MWVLCRSSFIFSMFVFLLKQVIHSQTAGFSGTLSPQTLHRVSAMTLFLRGGFTILLAIVLTSFLAGFKLHGQGLFKIDTFSVSVLQIRFYADKLYQLSLSLFYWKVLTHANVFIIVFSMNLLNIAWVLLFLSHLFVILQ